MKPAILSLLALLTASLSSSCGGKNRHTGANGGAGGDDAGTAGLANGGASGNGIGGNAGDPDAGDPDAGVAEFTLPDLPADDHNLARHWVDLDAIKSLRRVAVRDGVAYLAGVPHGARIDLATYRVRSLDPAPDDSFSFEDVVAPPGSSVVVAVLLRGQAERLIRYSTDGGDSFRTATAPPANTGGCGWARTTWARAAQGPLRLFAMCGGPSLDMSEDDGATWTRLIDHDGESLSVPGFTSDASGKVLWFASEAVLDIVTGNWLDLSGPLASEWHTKIAYPDSNGVYSAAADPHAPPAVYMGEEGRLGYFTMSGSGDLSVETPWTADLAAGEPFTYVWAIWADPAVPNHVVFGGGDRDVGATLHESFARGSGATRIPIEGNPLQSTVLDVTPSLDNLHLIVFVGGGSDGTGHSGKPRLYVLAR